MTIEKKYNPRCFFDVEVGEKPVGRIVFELFADVCPITCENFRAICTGECGLGKTTGKPLHYKGVKFHRVIKNFMIQGGDFSVGNGSGGESIYGGTFKDECFDVRHDQPFLLSMANRGKDTNGSQFFITTQRTPHLDGIHVVFGRVIKGEDIIQSIENQPTDANSSPLQPVVISNCGELVLKKKQKEKKRRKTSASPSKSEAESDVEGTEKGEKKKHKKHHKHRSKKSKKEKGKNDESHEKENPDDDADEFTINPKEIPEVPANNFLMRRVDPVDDNYRGPPTRGGGFNRRPMMSRSGRKIKGRGFMRYRTPSPEGGRSGSETPPHWKQAQSRIRPFREFEDTAKETENPDANEEEGVAPEGMETDSAVEKPRSQEQGEAKQDRGNRDRNRARERDRNRNRGQDYNRDRGSEGERKRERNRDRPQDPDRSQQKQRSREQNRGRDAQQDEEPKRERPSRNGSTSNPVKRDRRDRDDEPPPSRNRHDHHDKRRSPSRDGKSRRESRRRPDESSKTPAEGDHHRSHQDSRRGVHGAQEEKPNIPVQSSGASHAAKEMGTLGSDVHKNDTVDSSRNDGRRGVTSSIGKDQNAHQSESGSMMSIVPPGARHLSSLPVMVDPTEPPPPGVEPDEFSLNMVESLSSSQTKWDSKLPSGSSHKDSALTSSEVKKAPTPAAPRRNRWSSGPPSSNPVPDEEPKKRASEPERPPEPATASTARTPNKPQIERRSGNASSSNRRQSLESEQKKSDQSPERRQKQSTRRGRSSSSASPRRRPSRSRSRGRRGRTRSSSEGRRRRQRNRSRSRSRKKSHRSASSSSRSDRGRTRNRRRNRDSSDDGNRGRSRRARRRPSSSSSDSSSSSSSADSGSSGRRRRRKGGRQSRQRRRSSTSSSGSSSS
ncbi:peptidyl-prolyl cis-trans isomerase G-like [Ornithodoros turicata]|uniref:peptidylprolyl isomerase n=1 Tax=Ornithodoros turicata TaxID=34597 RepID=A0A2R5LMQ9_9ACAR